MPRKLVLSITLLCLLAAGAAEAASVEQAKAYLQNREPERAKQELERVLASAAADQEKAAALDLMASIAVEEQDYATATEMWSRLVDDYPELAEELGAATKLQLARALVGRGEVVEEPRTSPPPVEQAPAPATATPETAPPSAAAPAPQAREEKAPSPRVPGLVLVAAAGKPYDAAQYSGDKLTAFLVGRGVNAESPTGGIPVVEDSATSLARMLEAVEDRGAESLAFMRVNFKTWEKIELEVYSADGSLLWEERIRGGTGHTGRPYSKTGVNENLLQRFLEKLEERVGSPGLPVSR